ncbi:calcium uniporter protein [Tanacetum coccineum]
MLVDIPRKWNQLWDTWDIRGCIILSLSLQTVLILLAPFRKRTNSNWILMPLWSAYLLADWVANFCIGLISSRLWNPTESSSDAIENEDLFVFWAPFLLLHLGGQDNITAFALEDNELWLRHLFGLVFQCLAVVYTFVQSLPKNQLWVPTMFIFMTGIIKYAERTRSLYLASADSYKDSMLPRADVGTNYAKIVDQFNWWHAQKLPTRIQMVPEPKRAGAITINMAKRGKLTALEVIHHGYRFFEAFKGLVVDMFLNRKERNKSRDFFMKRTAKDAFQVVEVELNFIYEVLYTKLPVVYGYFGAAVRFFYLLAVCSAIVMFTLKNKSVFKSVDVMITYCILYGALVLDLTALFFFVFSDRTIIFLQKSPPDDDELINNISPSRTRILKAVLMLMNKGTVCDSRAKTPRVLESRWSESISSYNLINYCLYPSSGFLKFVCKNLGLIGFHDSIKYVKAVGLW